MSFLLEDGINNVEHSSKNISSKLNLHLACVLTICFNSDFSEVPLRDTVVSLDSPSPAAIRTFAHQSSPPSSLRLSVIWPLPLIALISALVTLACYLLKLPAAVPSSSERCLFLPPPTVGSWPFAQYCFLLRRSDQLQKGSPGQATGVLF